MEVQNDNGAAPAKITALGGQAGGSIRASAFVKKLQAKTKKKNKNITKMLIAFIPLFLLVGLGALVLSSLELTNEYNNAIANNEQHEVLYGLNDDLGARSENMMKAETFGRILHHTTGVENSSFAYNSTMTWCGSEVSDIYSGTARRGTCMKIGHMNKLANFIVVVLDIYPTSN